MAKYNFTMTASGRDGSIRCSDGINVVELYWEMSGSPEFDILLCPLKLMSWDSGIAIPRESQFQILSELREWLRGKKVRSDAAAPSNLNSKDELCRWSGCSAHALMNSAYCARHYDESLFR